MITKTPEWIVEMCNWHIQVHKSDYYLFESLQEALKSKGTCQNCQIQPPVREYKNYERE